MKVIEISPGQFELGCEISGRPHARTNQFGMFCDDPNCECERKSMAAMPALGNFVNAAAKMFEKGGNLDYDALSKLFPKDGK
jgi:hypothetical protein